MNARVIGILFLGSLMCSGGAAAQNRTPPVIHRALLNSLGQQPTDEFANAVAVDGNTVVVGAISAEVNGIPTGAAYVYVKPSSGWTNMTQTAMLTGSDKPYHFGASVAISGDTIVVGAPWTNVNGSFQEGAVYVYVKPPGGWTNMTETAKLTGFHVDAIGEDWIGTTVSISGNTIVAGVPNVIPDYRSFGYGEAFIYVKPAGGWTDMTETAVLYNQVALGFADDVAVSGNTVVVGSDGCCSQGLSVEGVALVFTEPASGWQDTENYNAALTGTEVGIDDSFGYAVAIDGKTIVVGSPQMDSWQVGAAYVYVEPPEGWTSMSQTAELYPFFTVLGDFGESLAISRNTVLIGDPFSNGTKGAAYVFAEPKTGWHSTSNDNAMLSNRNGYGYGFGQSVSISGATAVVGFGGTYDTNGGAVVFWVSQ